MKKEDVVLGERTLSWLTEYYKTQPFGHNVASKHKYYIERGSSNLWKVIDVVTRYDFDGDPELFRKEQWKKFCITYKISSDTTEESLDLSSHNTWVYYVTEELKYRQTMYFLESIEGDRKLCCNQRTFWDDFEIYRGKLEVKQPTT